MDANIHAMSEVLCCLSPVVAVKVVSIQRDTGLPERDVHGLLREAKAQKMCLLRGKKAILVNSEQLDAVLSKYWRRTRGSSHDHLYVRRKQCLKCDTSFWSKGPFSKLCERCNSENKEISDRRVKISFA